MLKKYIDDVQIVAIVGPTAVGKTAVAIELAEMTDGEILSADSMAVYRGMDVGTAKPNMAEQQRARFHLIDIVNPDEPFNVGLFQNLAHNIIDNIIENDRLPIVVGGSGLYVRAAIDGLDDTLPADDMNLRKQLEEMAEIHGKEYLHKQLSEVDPVSAERIHPNNLKRVIRALEIYKTTGIPASTHYNRSSENLSQRPKPYMFGLTMERDILYRQIDDRVDGMLENGLVEEVSKLLSLNIDLSYTSMQGLGYKEIASYLLGDVTKDEAISILKRNTRRFAKRQYTWFKADSRVNWISIENRPAYDIACQIKEIMKNDEKPDEPAG